MHWQNRAVAAASDWEDRVATAADDDANDSVFAGSALGESAISQELTHDGYPIVRGTFSRAAEEVLTRMARRTAQRVHDSRVNTPSTLACL